MKISQDGINFVKGFEGFRGSVYNDLVGVATLGYGMTGTSIKGLTSITELVASTMLEDLINRNYGNPLSKDLARLGVILNQNQFDALTSMAYNVGVAGLLGSTLYRDIANGIRDKNTITKDFAMWCKAGGNTVQGLVRRRSEEATMFLKATNNVILTTAKVSAPQPTGHADIKILQKELNLQCKANIKVDGWGGKLTLAACPTVRPGAKGNITKWIQTKIGMEAKYRTGNFLSLTETAVKAYQNSKKIFVDGIVGQNTWKELLK